MFSAERVVLDTGTLISSVLFVDSTPARAVHRAFSECKVLVSNSTLAELQKVLQRPKFDRYVSLKRRHAFLATIEARAEMVVVESAIALCRDPADNQFLALAVDGKADLLVSGDLDLLTLERIGKCEIVTASRFLALP